MIRVSLAAALRECCGEGEWILEARNFENISNPEHFKIEPSHYPVILLAGKFTNLGSSEDIHAQFCSDARRMFGVSMPVVSLSSAGLGVEGVHCITHIEPSKILESLREITIEGREGREGRSTTR